ncbi:carboxylate-amine ligase [Nocardioides sp.]|uniref:carboxylate-amine ligase n=1 Tax=Nocardioides sp. TaxID=35761 RepID=UPI003D0D6193
MVRTVGIEEEFLLVDPGTGRVRAEAADVLRGCRSRLGTWTGGRPAAHSNPEAKEEFFQEEVELATRPCRSMEELAAQVIVGREALAESAADNAVAAVALGLPPLGEGPGTVSPGPRYQHIHRTYGELASRSLMCALHVHVQVESQSEAVAVLDRLRPWLPLIVAMTSNSPYHGGQSTGHQSWRSRLWEMWPSSGPPEAFRTEAAYRATADRLVAWGAAQDPALLNFGARASATYPTVEIRVGDSCTEAADSLLVAALVRALVETCARRWATGVDGPSWRSEELRAAHWRAARYGLSGELVDPLELHLVPAATALRQLQHEVTPALRDAGDEELVAAELARLLDTGSGADRQQQVFAATGSLPAVVADAHRRTAGPAHAPHSVPPRR